MPTAKNARLVLHTGGYSASLDEVRATVTPGETETHVPIPHIMFIEQVLKGLAAARLEVLQAQHALAKGGNRYFGLLQLRNLGLADDYALTLGLRNSHDKTYPCGMVAGASVFVCDNLSFSGETKVTRKHTVHVARDLPARVDLGISRLNEMWVNQEKRFEAYKERTLDNAETVAHLIMQAHDKGAMPWTLGKKVWTEWQTPSHEEFKKNNVWRLFNAFTEAGKDTSVFDTPFRTMKLHQLMDAFCGIAFNAEGAIEI